MPKILEMYYKVDQTEPISMSPLPPRGGVWVQQPILGGGGAVWPNVLAPPHKQAASDQRDKVSSDYTVVIPTAIKHEEEQRRRKIS